jgi:putative nucleotidyltransferase with HDIG domain
VLFVDDDQTVLQELQRALRSVRGEWTVEFALTLPDALAQLSHGVFDVVVADVNWRGANGGSFLDDVASRQPNAIRFLLSESAGRGMLMRAGGSAHQHLSMPLHAEAVFARLGQTLALGDLLSDAYLRGLVARLKSVPSLPSIYLAIMAEIRQEEASARKVGELVARDAGMAAKILQLVNSPFFGFRMHVSDPAQAVQLMGLETVRALVLSLHIFEQLHEREVRRFRLGRVWRHSLATTNFARLIARMQDGNAQVMSEAFTAALLHDIGKLVLAASLPDEYEAAVTLAEREAMPLWLAEKDVLKTTHAEVGAYLLGLWGLPDPIVETVAWHHRPSDCPSIHFCPLGAVHAANAIEHEMHPGDVVGRGTTVDEAYLTRLEVRWQYPAWKAVCLDSEGEGLGRGLGARM